MGYGKRPVVDLRHVVRNGDVLQATCLHERHFGDLRQPDRQGGLLDSTVVKHLLPKVRHRTRKDDFFESSRPAESRLADFGQLAGLGLGVLEFDGSQLAAVGKALFFDFGHRRGDFDLDDAASVKRLLADDLDGVGNDDVLGRAFIPH